MTQPWVTQRPSVAGMNANELYAALNHFDPVLVGYRGSIAHGMYVPSSDPLSIDDKDLMCVVFANEDNYFGLENFETKETMIREWDIVTYELRKFVRLLEKSNPNVLSLLWLKQEHYVFTSEAGKALIDNRQLFATRAIYKSFTGYAYGQLRRMEHFKHDGYMGEKRKSLVERFGYDTKNAAHLIRLLKMGIEFLKTGELQVYRDHDSQQLLAIKRGEWALTKVKEEAHHLFRRAELAMDDSVLPYKPDRLKVNELLRHLFQIRFGLRIRTNA